VHADNQLILLTNDGKCAKINDMNGIISKLKETNLEGFLQKLSELSQQYGIAITGDPVLFVMEQEDYALLYRVDEESALFRS